MSTLINPLIGPLTTTFTPPASCIISEAITTGNGNSTLFLSQSLFNNGPSGAPSIHRECFPEKYPHDESFYYSPGICPSGWVLNTSPGVQQLFATPSLSGETIGICCPTRYTYKTDGPLGCSSYLTRSTPASLLNPSYFIYFGLATPYTLVQTLTTLGTDVTITAIHLVR
jgi:hypothetical protein